MLYLSLYCLYYNIQFISFVITLISNILSIYTVYYLDIINNKLLYFMYYISSTYRWNIILKYIILMFLITHHFEETADVVKQ